MRRPSTSLLSSSAVVLAALLIASLAFAAGPDPNNVEAIAIYSALTGSDELADADVNYDIFDPGTINQLLTDIEWRVERECSGLDTDNASYMYVRFFDGTRTVYHLFLRNTHISIKDNRGTCFYVGSVAQSLIDSHTQS